LQHTHTFDKNVVQFFFIQLITKSAIYIMKQIIMQGGAELTDTLQNTVLPYSVEGGPESAHQE